MCLPSLIVTACLTVANLGSNLYLLHSASLGLTLGQMETKDYEAEILEGLSS